MKKLLVSFSALLFLSTSAIAAQRIVSADGSLTEIVYALGEQDKLVGVDTTSGYPAIAKTLPQIGYKRNISAEGVLSLTPTILIATQDSGPDKILSQVEQAGVDVRKFSAEPSLHAVQDKILGVAQILGVTDKGAQLWQQVDLQVQQARQRLSAIDKPVKVMFVLSSGQGSPIVSGGNTMADAIIKLAGATNAVQGFDGYKPMPSEAIIQAAPDIVLMMDRAGDHGADSSLLDSAGFELTPAGSNKRMIKMDGMLMLGFGPRIAQAITKLSEAFYPALISVNTDGA